MKRHFSQPSTTFLNPQLIFCLLISCEVSECESILLRIRKLVKWHFEPKILTIRAWIKVTIFRLSSTGCLTILKHDSSTNRGTHHSFGFLMLPPGTSHWICLCECKREVFSHRELAALQSLN